MLKGKILSIQWQGKWHVILDNHRKKFDYWWEVQAYIERVLDKGKDPKKKEQLKEDAKKLFNIND